MARIFGVDFSGELARAMGPGLLPGQMFIVTPGTRDANNLAAGTRSSERAVSFRGIVEEYHESQFEGTSIQRGDKKVLILAGTLPAGVVPAEGYRVKIDGLEMFVHGIPTRDPATAHYICQCRG